jgi:hypothetical protein
MIVVGKISLFFMYTKELFCLFYNSLEISFFLAKFYYVVLALNYCRYGDWGRENISVIFLVMIL